MKAFRYIALGVGGPAILAAIAAVAAAMLFDPNKYKGEIERLVKEQKNRTLKIEGDLKLAFWPSLGASLGKASLSERSSSAEFASLESAHVSVALMPLLRGEAVVDAVRLAGLRANIVKGKDGEFNFHDLLEAKPAAKSAAAPEPGKEIRFDISAVRIEHANVAYRDAASGQELAIEDMGFRTGRIADDVPGKLELQASVKGKSPELDVRISIAGGYRFNLARKALELSGLDAKAKGTLGKDSFEAKLIAPAFSSAPGKAGGDAVSAELNIASADGGSLKASVASPVSANLEAKLVELTKLAATVTIASPKMPQQSLTLPISGSARVDYGKESVTAEIGTKFDESTLQAKLAATRFEHPSYSFELNIDRLNLDRYLPPKTESSKSHAAGDVPIDLSGIKGLTAEGHIQIGAFQIERIKISDLKAEVHAANGLLQVSPHAANLYGGSLAGALSLNANGNQVTLKETLTNVAIGPLLKDLAERDALEGHGTIVLDVSASGASVNAMKKALAGSARLQLRDGAVKGINLAETLRQAKSMLGSKSAQQQGADKSQKTDFSELSASFAIKGGVAHNNDLNAKAPLFRLTGAGDVDVGHSTLNYLAKASVVATSKGQGGADLGQLAGVAIPVRLTGPFDAPKYEIEFGVMAADLAKSRITEAIAEKLGGKAGGTGGKTADVLRGLFGR